MNRAAVGATGVKGGGSQQLLQHVVTIPVVVHVIYNNANQNISNTQIQSQIDVLNEDFRRLNADTGITRNIFKPFAGDAMVQFCLAQRDPAGNVTDGITRTATTQISWGCDDSMKYSAYGGQDGWPGDQYLNIWVCNLNCANGYAYFPGTPDPYDGVVVHYYVFGRIGTVAPGYQGRTGTHEVGHYLGLYHPFDYQLCVGTSPSNCGSSGDLICDTPASDYPGYGCDTTLNSCTDSPVDFPNQVENFMDYADDNCRNMFSLDQIARMQLMLATYRNSLTTSPGCISPLSTYYDASLVEITEPVNEICTSPVNIYVRIGNISSGTLNALDIHYRLDNNPYSLYSWNGAINTGTTGTVLLPALPVPPGSHTLDCYVSNPNGLNDQNHLNDTNTVSFSYLVPGDGLPLPFTEGFEGGAFPLPGWFLINPDYDRVWERTTDAGGFGASAASALFRNFYNGSTGTHDGLLLPKLDFTTTQNTAVTFDVAYAEPASVFYADTLKLFYSLDCGKTYTQLYAKGGQQLSTAPPLGSFAEFVPDSSQWRTETVNVPAATGNALVTFKFENVSHWGNNLYVDNINIPFIAGMHDPGYPAVVVYPNPSHGIINILIPVSAGAVSWMLLDATGRKVWEGERLSQNGKLDLDLSHFENGMYFLQLHTSAFGVVNKISVMK